MSDVREKDFREKGFINISFPAFQLSVLSARFTADQKKIDAALKRAVSRTTKWVYSQASREVAQAVHLKLKLIRQRGKKSIRGKSGIVFVGLDPVSLRRMNPRQGKTGVTAGPAKAPGAWIDPNTAKLHGIVVKRRYADRFPIDKQTYAISDVAKPILEKIEDDMLEKLINEFEHELKWQTRNSRK